MRSFWLAVIFTTQWISALDICVHECTEPNACTNATIHCHACLHTCSIRCIGKASCNNLHIVQSPSSITMANIQCEGTHTCTNITITTANYAAHEDINSDVSSDLLSFVCECIPMAIYQIYRHLVMDMFDFVKDENFWLFKLNDLLQNALDTSHTAQLIEYHVDDTNRKRSFYIHDESRSDDVSMDYIIHSVLDYNNDCEQMDHYILSHLDSMPPNMEIVCYFHGIKYELLKTLHSSRSEHTIVTKAKVITVYDSQSTLELDSLVVLKFFDMSSSKYDSRFVKQEVESQKLSNAVIGDKSVKLIDHSDIISNEVETDGFRFVIVMEYISDGDLSTYIKRVLYTKTEFASPPKQEEFAKFMVCRLLDDITASMSHLYQYKELRYLHNDIKPSNIFMDRSAMMFKLADYGHMMPISFFLNVSNDIGGLGTPDYIPLPMSDLMLNLYGDEMLYRKAKEMYFKYPNHADLYQVLASALSLYNTLCDPQYRYDGDTESICRQITDKTLDLDVNAEDTSSPFMVYVEEDEDEDGLLYAVNKARYDRLRHIEYNGTKHNEVFHLILENINGLTDDYLKYRRNETEQINIDDVNNDTYSLETFRKKLETVCGAYMIPNAGTLSSKERFNHQMWKYENERVVLHKILLDGIDVNKGIEDGDDDESVCKDYIIYDRRNNGIVYPKKENTTNIHEVLKKRASSFNVYYSLSDLTN